MDDTLVEEGARQATHRMLRRARGESTREGDEALEAREARARREVRGTGEGLEAREVEEVRRAGARARGSGTVGSRSLGVEHHNARRRATGTVVQLVLAEFVRDPEEPPRSGTIVGAPIANRPSDLQRALKIMGRVGCQKCLERLARCVLRGANIRRFVCVTFHYGNRLHASLHDESAEKPGVVPKFRKKALEHVAGHENGGAKLLV